MKRKQILLLGVAAIAVNLIAFQAGRRVAQSNWNIRGGRSSADLLVQSSSRSRAGSDEIDLTNARIADLGTLGFEQAFDLLCDATPQLRQKWAKELDGLAYGAQQRVAVDTFYRILVQLDPKEAAALAMNSTVGNRVAGIMVQAAPDSALPDLAEVAVKFARNWPPPVSNLVNRWSRVDPVAASRFLDRHPEQARDYVYLLLANWAAVDFTSAKAWFDGRPLDQQNADAVRGLLTGWAMSDRPAAAEYLVAHANEERFQGAFEDVSQYLFRTAPDEAREFVLRLPDDEGKHAAINHMLDLRTIYSSGFWKFSPAVKTAWLGQLPSDLTREHLSDMGAAWRDGDSNEFRAWADALPRDSRNLAVSGYCKAAIYQDDFADVITLTQTISDKALREETVRSYLERTNLTADEQIDIVRGLPLQRSDKQALVTLIGERKK